MSQLLTPFNISTAITTCNEVVRCAGWQAFDEKMMTSTLKTINKVLVEGPTIDTLVKVVETSYEVINDVVSQWTEHKSEKFTETDHTIVTDFLEYTHNTLGLCSEVNKFLRAARDRHSNIEYVASLWTYNMIDEMKSEDFKEILEDLKNLKDSEAYDLTCKNLFTKVGYFMSQQENMFTNLNRETQLQSEEKKTDGCGWSWRSVFRGMITIGCSVGILVLRIVVVITDQLPKKIADALANAGKMAEEGLIAWCTSLSEALGEHVFSTQTEILKKNKLLIVTELQDIDLLVNTMEAEIDSILVNVNYAIDRGNVGLAMKDMSVKADKFLKKIEESEGKIERCVSNITEAREEVKSTLLSKNKRSCSIM